MKCLIAGSRTVCDYEVVKTAIEESRFVITEVVSGGARGVDRLGEKWAKENGVAVKQFFPDWETHGKKAGFLRNADMIDYVENGGCVIAIWDGVSRGTQHTIGLARKYKIPLFVKLVKP